MRTSPNAKASYDYWFDGDLLCLKDLNGERSLTNDMENVLQDIVSKEQLAIDVLHGKKILYQDSMGVWDGVKVKFIERVVPGGGKVIEIRGFDFYTLGNARDFQTAKAFILQIQ